MKKSVLILFAILAIGAIAPAVQAQWGYYHPYGYYYRTWDPFYYGPVVVYDPVRARQLEIENNLEKLNESSNALLNSEDYEEINKEAGDIAESAEDLREALANRESSNAPISSVGSSPADIQNAAETIKNLVEEVNETDIDVETVNIARSQRTINLLREIESLARGIERTTESD